MNTRLLLFLAILATLGVHAQQQFPTAEAATHALAQAALARNREAVRTLFGPEVTNLLTGDENLDRANFEAFATDLREKCLIDTNSGDRRMLIIGDENWHFPIPLVRTNNAWLFDTKAGEDEIIDRHIGRDEWHAIELCRQYVKEQLARHNAGKEYAQSFADLPGWTNNGPSYGYVFQILTRQGREAPGGRMKYLQNGAMNGGFALLAYPLNWGESGIMTFLVGANGAVYQRCFGEKTERLAPRICEYNPDKNWTAVQDTELIGLNANASNP